MHYLYDIWVNWFDGEEEGYNVCSYHEWRKRDTIEMVDQIPVLYITTQLFDYIENSLSPLPNELLNLIYRKTYIRKGYERKALDYACIVTDDIDVLAFDTLGYEIPLRKSRLIPRQERQVYEICAKGERMSFDMPENMELSKKEWSMPKQYMVGLTRRERELKKLLFVGLEHLKHSQNKEEICYWLSEWEGSNKSFFKKDLTIERAWNRLYEQIIIGWSEKHEHFLSLLIRGNAILEKYWEEEENINKNKENQK